MVGLLLKGDNDMYATEFKTTIKGSTVQIPDYENFKNKQVKVIILESDENKNVIKKDDFISKMIKEPKHVPAGLKFMSRDEANER